MGKGDTPRPVDKEKYDASYKRVFGEKPLNIWEDAPGREPEDRPDDRPASGVQETTGGRADPETDEPMEGEGEV